MSRDNTAEALVSPTMMTTTTTTMIPTAVVSSEFNEKYLPLRNAWVATLRDKRDISRVIGKIGKFLPSLSHLKRCSSKRLVINFAPCSNEEIESSRLEIERLLVANGCDLSLFVDEKLEIVKVPAVAPRTKAQATRAAKIWPVNFHPDPVVERNLDGSCFDRKDLDRIDQCTRVCIEAAALEAHGSNECNGSAVVFDPITDSIIAIAASRIDRHPMWHATILAVDLVASRHDGGGAYELSSCNARGSERSSSSLSLLDGPTLPKHARREEETPTLPTIAYPANLADIPARLFESTSPIHADNADYVPAYLCTDYWIFLLCEPCSLCAMALVHSRVSNVFYGVANEHRGVLESRAMLHELPGLNHRYRVWKGIREDECRSTLIKISDRSG